MRVLFATTRGAGHLGPMIPLARSCRRAGHDVLVAGPSSAGRRASGAGLPFAPVGEPPADVVREAWAPVWSRTEAPGAAHVVRELFIGLHARAAMPQMLDTVASWRPDVVVRETLEFSSALAAEGAGVPQVRHGIHLVARVDVDEGLVAMGAPALDALRPLAGLGPDPHARRIRDSPVVTLAPSSMDDPGARDRPVHRFRDTERARDESLPEWPGREHLPLVYLSFGSEAPASALFPGVYRDALAGLADLPVRVLVTIGDGREPAALGPQPDGVRVERWFAQPVAMANAAVAVGHGGSGSTLIALTAGVPQAIVPLFVDGPDNARRVAAAGAGIVVEDGPAAVAAAVRRLLDDPAYRAGAGAVAAEIGALPPIDEAVPLLERIARDPPRAGGHWPTGPDPAAPPL